MVRLFRVWWTDEMEGCYIPAALTVRKQTPPAPRSVEMQRTRRLFELGHFPYCHPFLSEKGQELSVHHGLVRKDLGGRMGNGSIHVYLRGQSAPMNFNPGLPVGACLTLTKSVDTKKSLLLFSKREKKKGSNSGALMSTVYRALIIW